MALSNTLAASQVNRDSATRFGSESADRSKSRSASAEAANPMPVEHRHLGATGDGAAAIEPQRGAPARGGKAVHRARERAGRFEPAVQPGGAEDAEEQAVTAETGTGSGSIP